MPGIDSDSGNTGMNKTKLLFSVELPYYNRGERNVCVCVCSAVDNDYEEDKAGKELGQLGKAS